MKMCKCERCGKTWGYSPLQNVSFPVVYLGIGIEADLCSECRKKRLSEYAKRRKLNELGAAARWGKKKEAMKDEKG